MRLAISHSSRWFRNLMNMVALQRAMKRPPAARWPAGGPDGAGASALEAGGRVQLVDDLLADPALGLLVDRQQFVDPGFALRVGQVMQRSLAGSLDFGQRVVVLFLGDRVGVIGRF